MPELPEVETIRRQLAPRVSGRSIETVRVRHPRAVRAHGLPEDFARLLRGRAIQDVLRRGKALLFPLDDDRSLLVRLGMSGRLRVVDPTTPLDSHTHAILGLSDGAELRFIDPRTFGQLAVVEGRHPDHMAAFAHYGVEPLDDAFTPAALRDALAGRKALVQAALMDQSKIAGIGKIYADEACFLAGIHPERQARTLTEPEIGRLHAAIREVLARAIDARGTSNKDAAYRDATGQAGEFQHQLHVYQQAGRPCRVCGTPIEFRPFQGRRMHFCPRCQR